ncbi:5-oxoprolinase subunit PxpA [Rheinheimera texasensis]|uniref:5-oxoprolinase subunit PxpA n=1 Tax=Rheinheimera texasensis TaxID=306205 RepID=UPI0004E28792|nr:5-oxoprolinase subunit PxpA [Rheinheimera texasensis]
MKHIDLNADLGEGCGDDLAIIPLLSSANISCGTHAGTEEDILAALLACKQHQVCVGAHPSYPDRANFGRLPLNLDPAALTQSLQQQLKYFKELAERAGVRMSYIKPHGALYNKAAVDHDLAGLIVDLIKTQHPDVAVLTLPDSALSELGKAAGIAVFHEAFADRAYTAIGQLVPRSQTGAVLDHQAALTQSLRLISTGTVISIDQQEISFQADSLCVHGDSPEALQLVHELSAALQQAGVSIRPFIGSAE